jgi:perosamine synthetase
MVKPTYLPYGRQCIDAADVAAVAEVLLSDWLTTGPKVAEFEAAVAGLAGAKHGVAVSSGTAALHGVMHALGIGPGDEVIVPPMTFAATANCVLYQGARPVFADVDPDTLLLDPEAVRAKLTPRTKAIVAVDYAGQPCDYERLGAIARSVGAALAADACHSLGAACLGRPVGSLADLSVFSFHPVKHITTGEGGMVVTNDAGLADRVRRFRNHGIDLDHRQREAKASWRYEVVELGFNYRLTDIQCALGLSQLGKLSGFIDRRRSLASVYDAAFAAMPEVCPLAVRPAVFHAYHLYVVLLPDEPTRDAAFAALRAEGIGVNVHYLPVHLHPYYQKTLGTGPGLCPKAEAASKRILSLPLHPGMNEADVRRVVDALRKFFAKGDAA